MPLKENLKAIIIQNGFTMSQVVEEINKQNNTNYSIQNFSAKRSRGTLKYNEVEQVLDIIGYKIEWLKK